MPPLLEIRDAKKRYGQQQLLDGATATITDEHKVGMIGRNGAGKSTLCRVLLGEEELDAGEVNHHPRLRLGYLRQHDPFEPGESVLEFLMRDSRQPDWKCGEVAGEFEIKGAMLDRPVQELSGGWQTRVKLAALLLHDPNLLVMDEPTNFLDLRTQMLLEHFLKHFRGACLVVSHDRAFLNATCSETLELSRGKLTLFPGKVDAFLEFQQQRREHDERVNASVMTKRRQLETFINKNRAKASTASQARSKQKQLDRLELIEIEGAESTVRIRPPQVEARRGPAVRCMDLSIGYSDHTVATGVDVEITHGSRIAVVGDNGQGKTTFLRTLVGSLEPLAGEVRWGFGCDVGCYAQHVYASLDPRETVFDYLMRASTDTRTQTILATAGSFLFRDDDVNKRIEVLSGGERARLVLAGLLLGKHNVLLLDEPGNHLDVDTVEALIDALNEYQGTVVFTSHDRYFMRRVSTSVVEVRDGGVAQYPGDYDTYVYRVGREIDEGLRTLAPPRPPEPPSSGQTDGKPAPRKAGQAQWNLRKEISSLERKIARLDDQKRQLNERMCSETDPNGVQKLHAEASGIGEELTELENRWLELQEEVES